MHLALAPLRSHGAPSKSFRALTTCPANPPEVRRISALWENGKLVFWVEYRAIKVTLGNPDASVANFALGFWMRSFMDKLEQLRA